MGETASEPVSTDLPGGPLAMPFGPLRLASPVVLAAGTAGVLDEFVDVLDPARLGAIVTKSITAEPREGNETWRVAPLRAGMLNAVGLANPGVERFVAAHAPRAAGLGCPVFASVAGYDVAAYASTAAAIDAAGVFPAIELNVSCPNVHGGTEFGTDLGALREVVSAVVAAVGRSMVGVKLSPVAVGRPGIEELARTAVDSGAAFLTVANTVPAMAIDVRTRRPLLSNVTGGLSGPAVHPIAVGLVHRVYRSVARDAGVPIIGLGGVSGWKDAAEFVLAGAAAVGIGTALFADPAAPLKIGRGLARWARSSGVGRVSELIGAVRLP